jgi:hypothetical protein
VVVISFLLLDGSFYLGSEALAGLAAATGRAAPAMDAIADLVVAGFAGGNRKGRNASDRARDPKHDADHEQDEKSRRNNGTKGESVIHDCFSG